MCSGCRLEQSFRFSREGDILFPPHKSEVLYEYLNKELTSCNNIRNSLINNKEQSISIKSRIHAIDDDIDVINKALGRWKE